MGEGKWRVATGSRFLEVCVEVMKGLRHCQRKLAS